MIVRKSVGTKQIALPDLDPIDAQLSRGNVEQALDHEDTVLPTGAAHRRDERLIGEDRCKFTLVASDVVGTEQACTDC